MKKINVTSILLLAGILLILNILSQRFFKRIDLTEGGQYTLSQATEDILKDLDQPVTIRAYFSEGISPEVKKIKSDFQEMLMEYKNLSNGMLEYVFVDPSKSEELKTEAAQNRIPELLVSVREKDQSKQAKAFMGAVMTMGEKKEIIPAVVSTDGLEYTLTTNIKKMAIRKKPAVGILQGHGEPGPQELGQVYQTMSILDSVVFLDLDMQPGSLNGFSAIAILAPSDSFPPNHLALLDEYLNNGGQLFIGINRVTGDLQSQSGTVVNTGLETWLRAKGLEVEPSFVLDAQCGTVTVQQQQAFFVMNTPVQFPYLPLLTDLSGHPITDGLEQVILPFASPVNFRGTTGQFTPFLVSSSRSAASPAPTQFDVLNKTWTAADFTMSNITLGGVLNGLPGGGKIIVVGDGDFPVSAQGRGQNNDNVSLFVNSIDWLIDDTGLIELRTKGIATRPIDEAYLGDENLGKRNWLKYLNFGLPILLVLLFWFLRSQRQRNLRMKRMQERYA